MTYLSLPTLTRFLVALCLPLLSSCSILGLRKQVEQLDAHGAITIRISPASKGPAPTYALAWIEENGVRKESAGFQTVRPDGLAAFTLLANRTYHIGAFTDENGNRAYDAGEPLAVLTDMHPRLLDRPDVQPKLWKLTLQRYHGLPSGAVIAVPKEDKKLGGAMKVAFGEVVSLDDPRFAAQDGSEGLWRPLEFLTGNAVGIYFTEPYDPARIPVVFVYGIGGSPQDLRWLMEHFDKKRYQCWFLQYPSGVRLERVATTLAAGLNLLKHEHHFERCYLVAHSMGGLVSHVALAEAVRRERVNYIPRLVTISTPWGGHKAAESGIRHLKHPVPSWLDVAPASQYLTTLYATPLPAGTTHDLIYGSTPGGPFWMKEPNDGTVTVASETDPRAARKARSVTHYPYSHVGILSQEVTLGKVLESLRR
jgi:pimeloyl-ACP methyl ester carboxylesterase